MYGGCYRDRTGRVIEATIDSADFFVPCFRSSQRARGADFQAEIRYALDCARRPPLDEIFEIRRLECA